MITVVAMIPKHSIAKDVTRSTLCFPPYRTRSIAHNIANMAQTMLKYELG